MAENEAIAVHTEPTKPQADEDTITPLVDICESKDGTIVLVAEVPGATNDKVDLHVDKGVLTIHADCRRPEPAAQYSRTYSGFGFGQYFRAFALSDQVDRDKIEADLHDGVLTVQLPRAAAAKTRKIEIKS